MKLDNLELFVHSSITVYWICMEQPNMLLKQVTKDNYKELLYLRKLKESF